MCLLAQQLLVSALVLLTGTKRLLARTLLALLVGWLAAAPQLAAQGYDSAGEEEGPVASLIHRLPVNIAVGSDFLTRYVARGVPHSTGPIIRPWVAATRIPYHVKVKVLYDMELDEVKEVDLIFDYSLSLRSWLVQLGYNLFTSPTGRFSDVHEGSVNIVAPTFLNPAAKLYYHQFRGSGTLIMKLTLRHTLEFERSALDFRAVTVYRNNTSFIGTEFRMDVPIPMKQFTVIPTVRYSLSVKEEIADTFYGGMILQFAF